MRLKALAATTVAVLSVGSAGAVLAQPEGKDNQPPPQPAPRNEEGRVLLGGATPAEKGVWTPVFGIYDPVAPLDSVPFQPWSRQLYDERFEHKNEPHARCKASGASRQFLTPYGVEFVELRELGRLFIFDIGGPHSYRTVYMDGRSHPANPEPTNYGHSVGWWEGDTLVIDTVGYNEDFWFGRQGLPHTEQLHTVERFTRRDEDTIDYRITIDDPGAYTEPFEGGFNLRWNEGRELFEYICQQANYAEELMVGEEGGTARRSSSIVP